MIILLIINKFKYYVYISFIYINIQIKSKPILYPSYNINKYLLFIHIHILIIYKRTSFYLHY